VCFAIQRNHDILQYIKKKGCSIRASKSPKSLLLMMMIIDEEENSNKCEIQRKEITIVSGLLINAAISGLVPA
jgi:hypothetical protein